MWCIPLYKLTRKRVPFIWTQVESQALENIKNSLLNSPILAYLNFENEFIVTTGASNLGFGAMLSQMENVVEKTISTDSHSLGGQLFQTLYLWGPFHNKNGPPSVSILVFPKKSLFQTYKDEART